MAEHVSYWICSCGKSNLKSVNRCASCGKRRSRRKLYLSLAATTLLIILLSVFSSETPSEDLATSLPNAQLDFVSVIERAQADARASPNSLRSSEILRDRDQNLTRFAEVNDWRGTVRGVQSMQGKGAVSIEFNGVQVIAGVHLMYGLDTLIPQSSTEIYQSLLPLTAGDSVQFSGEFSVFQNSLVELSYTGSGSLSAPEFLFSFSQIEKID